MVNLRKLVAMLLIGCVACQSAQIYALPDIVNPDKYASATQYLERSRAYFAPFCDANKLLPKLINAESIAASLRQTEDAYVTGLIFGSFACFDRSLLKPDYKLGKMNANICSIAENMTKEKLRPVDIVAAYRAAINSFKVLAHLKNCSRFVVQDVLNTAKSGCINNFLIAIACLYSGGYKNLALFLYDYLPMGGKDEEKLLFDDLRVVNPFKGNCCESDEVVKSPKILLHLLDRLNDAYNTFDDSFFLAVKRDEMLMDIALGEYKRELFEERRAEIEAQAQKKEAARAKRIAERADKEAKRKEEEEAVRRKDEEAARLREQEEEKRKADEKAKRVAEEAEKRAEEEKLKAEHDKSGATEVIDANKTIRMSGANMRPAKLRHGKKL